MDVKKDDFEISAAGVRAERPTSTPRRRLVHRAHRFRLYPTKEQEQLLAKHFGSCRFVYNHFLAMKKALYESEKKSISLYETHHIVTEMKKSEEYAWLGDVYSHSLRASLGNLDGAYQKFFRKQSQFPRFHAKHDKQSCTFPDNVNVVDGRLKLPKFKATLRIRGGKPITGRICNATVSKTPTGRYFVSILCEDEIEALPQTDREIGIDVGIKEMAVCSDGERVANPKFLEKAEPHLKYLQRQVSRKVNGSKSRFRARQRLSRFHEKVANRRNDYIHTFTTRIVRENQTVCVEDLNVKGMASNHHLAKSIVSVSFGEIMRQLEYKCRWYGRSFVKVERFYPSSKMCHHCGAVNHGLTLSNREWVCPSCGAVIDRDFNAALNILKRGKEILSGCGKQSDIKQKGVEALQLCKSMKH